MKIKPYRVCDICGNSYDKADKCMKVKILYLPSYAQDDFKAMSKMDICPHCGRMMIEYLKNKKRAGD